MLEQDTGFDVSRCVEPDRVHKRVYTDQQIFDRDYSDRWKPGRAPDYQARDSRPVLSPERSLGSVIKLLTPSDDYTAEFNAWLAQ